MSEKDQHQYKDRYMLRLPDGMRNRIKAAAALNKHSMNSEIVNTLLKHYPEETKSKLFSRELISYMAVLSQMQPEDRMSYLTDLYDSGELREDVGSELEGLLFSELRKYCEIVKNKPAGKLDLNNLIG